MTPTAGTVVAERFRLVRLLGQGGMGAVWAAHHLGLDIPCAIKFIHAEAARSPEIRARFELEARSAAQLRSPHVVQILDHGVWDGSPYIAMEYLEGEDLGQRLRARGVLAPSDVAVVMSQVARALAKAHAAGLIHRDLKPANIFLARDDDREIVKVLDFGVAKSNVPGLSDSNTKTGAMLGTPYYMSPEQAQGTRVIDHRADLWSLGVVTYQLLTGSLPFKSEALGDLLMKIMMAPIPVPSQAAAVPPGFDAWFARAVSRDPAGRFASAKEFAETLADALGVPLNTRGELGLPPPSGAAPASQPGGAGAQSWPSAAHAPSWPTPAPVNPAQQAPSWPNAQSGAPSWPTASQLPMQDGPATVALQSGVGSFPHLGAAQTPYPAAAPSMPLASSSAHLASSSAPLASSSAPTPAKSRLGLLLGALAIGGLAAGALFLFLGRSAPTASQPSPAQTPSAPSPVAAPSPVPSPAPTVAVQAPIPSASVSASPAQAVAPTATAALPVAPVLPGKLPRAPRPQAPAQPAAPPPAGPHQPDFGI